LPSLDPINLLLIAAAYLLGAFSSAIALSRLMGFADPRSEGSKNPGATNVMRIAGKKAAALTLLGDLLKGLLPVLLAQLILQSPLWVALTGFAAFIGHCYPIYYRFQGGKGVATAIGFILAFHWITGLAVVSIWLVVAKLFKLSSLAALIAFTLMPIFYYLGTENPDSSAILALTSVILIWRHRQNIQRLLSGTENRS
jgi:glycerol-3-phosphate acyltransferase PlsY